MRRQRHNVGRLDFDQTDNTINRIGLAPDTVGTQYRSPLGRERRHHIGWIEALHQIGFFIALAQKRNGILKSRFNCFQKTPDSVPWNRHAHRPTLDDQLLIYIDRRRRTAFTYKKTHRHPSYERNWPSRDTA